MATFRVFGDTTVEVNDTEGSRSITFKSGDVVPADDNEGDFLVRCLVPWGLAEKLDEPPAPKPAKPAPEVPEDSPAPADPQEGK